MLYIANDNISHLNENEDQGWFTTQADLFDVRKPFDWSGLINPKYSINSSTELFQALNHKRLNNNTTIEQGTSNKRRKLEKDLLDQQKQYRRWLRMQKMEYQEEKDFVLSARVESPYTRNEIEKKRREYWSCFGG